MASNHESGALFVGGLVDGSSWPRLETLQHGPFPCPGIEGPAGVFDDARTLLHVTPDFDPARPFVIVVFFHGWCATLTRRAGGSRYHVVESYRLLDQVDDAGLNAVVVAPQFARDADLDVVDTPGHPGRFAEPGGFARFLDEATARIARQRGDDPARYGTAPVVLASFSGGYRAAAMALTIGGGADRVIGFLGLDTIYGETQAFASWFAANHRRAFIAAVYTGGREHDFASAGPTLDLARELADRHLPSVQVRDSLPRRLRPGVAAFHHVGDPDLHLDLVASGWPRFNAPVRRLLARLPGFIRTGR
ncbi:MAG TPA: hypothetical protein VJR58_28260 [Vineibacter sp.]|nr:hypothetical protein [Vineibacter sp.]